MEKQGNSIMLCKLLAMTWRKFEFATTIFRSEKHFVFRGEVPFYLVKNSWGAHYGNEGFIKIAVGRNICGIAESVAAIIVWRQTLLQIRFFGKQGTITEDWKRARRELLNKLTEILPNKLLRCFYSKLGLENMTCSSLNERGYRAVTILRHFPAHVKGLLHFSG